MISNEQPKINDTKIIATRLPFKCPVCGGFGTLQYGKKTCHGCEGKGYIVIAQEEQV